MKRNVLHSPHLLELKKGKRKIFWYKTLFFFFIFIILIIALSFVSHIERLNINSVEVSGNQVLDEDTIKETVQAKIDGKYAWVFPKTNIFLYPKGNIKDTLTREFKRIKNISLGVEKNALVINIDEHTGTYLWCGEIPNFEIGAPEEKCYFLDKDGYVFDEAPYFSGEVYFKFYGEVPILLGVPSGSHFAPEIFHNLLALKQNLLGIDLEPVILYLDNEGNIKIFLSKNSEKSHGPEIILKSSADFKKVVENLKAALGVEPLKSRFKNEYSSLQYIDLRFGNKVYFKFDE